MKKQTPLLCKLRFPPEKLALVIIHRFSPEPELDSKNRTTPLEKIPLKLKQGKKREKEGKSLSPRRMSLREKESERARAAAKLPAREGGGIVVASSSR